MGRGDACCLGGTMGGKAGEGGAAGDTVFSAASGEAATGLTVAMAAGATFSITAAWGAGGVGTGGCEAVEAAVRGDEAEPDRTAAAPDGSAVFAADTLVKAWLVGSSVPCGCASG